MYELVEKTRPGINPKDPICNSEIQDVKTKFSHKFGTKIHLVTKGDMH